MSKIEKIENEQAETEKIMHDFPYFVEYIYPLSWTEPKSAPHTYRWAKRIQNHKRTATLSARKHLKSTLMYAYIMWRIYRCIGYDESWLYMSYTSTLSAYHTTQIKRCIERNPFFNHIKDLSNSGSILKYSVDDKHIFSCVPASIQRFNRGWHGYGVICDDILADPTSELNITIIESINRAFFEEVLSLPIEGGEVHLVGTAQHQEDLFFKIKDNKTFDWCMYKAIVDEAKKEVLWPELFTYKRLCELRDDELGEKAFSKEYMCMPVWSADAFFTRDQILSVVDPDLKPERIKTRGHIVAGLDIGKHAHPSHLAIFRHIDNNYTMIYEEFFDNVGYFDQVNKINELVEFYGVDVLNYDNTRGEFEGFVEQRIIDNRIWKPINFNVKSKSEMAANFEKLVTTKQIILLNDPRMIRQILVVNNDLDALETNEGHGDAFWGIALALKKGKQYKPFLAV